MVKPFDFSDLLTKLEVQGLPMVEADAKLATTVILAWVEESLSLESNPLFKLLAPGVELIKPMILQYEDGIDGKVG